MRLPVAMLVACLSWPAADALSGEWKEVIPGYGVKVHSDTIRQSQDTDGSQVVEFLASWDTPKPVPSDDGGSFRSVKVQAKIFCGRRNYGTYALRGAGFSEAGMQGQMLFADRNLGYQSIEPDSVWYELRAKYCVSWWRKLIPEKLFDKNLFDKSLFDKGEKGP